MNSIHRKTLMTKSVMLAVAATAFMATSACATNAMLGAGEGQDPSQQVQYTMEPVRQAAARVHADPTYTYSPVATTGPLTREQVREELANWRNAGLLNPGGEIGDTAQTLAARQAYNEMQAEVITARWAQETQRMAKARETEYAAQLARDEIDAVLATAAMTPPIASTALAPSGTGDMSATAVSGSPTAASRSSRDEPPTDLPRDAVQPVMSEPQRELPARQ